MEIPIIYKDTISSLIKSGIIIKAPVDYISIDNLMKRAGKDLNTAKRNIDTDEECAFTYAYNAMLHCGLALMNSEGYRPEHSDKHKNIVRFCDTFLGDDFSDLVNIYDYMRKSRHKFLYEPDVPCTRKEAEDVLESATDFLKRMSTIIKQGNPQQEFGF